MVSISAKLIISAVGLLSHDTSNKVTIASGNKQRIVAFKYGVNICKNNMVRSIKPMFIEKIPKFLFMKTKIRYDEGKFFSTY